MGIISRVTDWWRGKATTSSANPSSWFVDWIGGGNKSSSGILVSQARAMRDTTVMACVSIRASDMAKLPVHVYQMQPDGSQRIVKNHAAERLLKRPNSWQNRMEFIEMMQSALLLHGNAYAAIERNGRGEATSLIPIPTSQVTVLTEPGGDIFYQWSTNNIHQQAVLSKFPNPIPADDVLHLKWISFDGIMGISRLNLARDAIGLSIALEEHSSRLFANGARPGGVLQTDKRLTDEGFKRFKAQWNQEYGGVDNFGKTPVLEEGLKWQPFAMTSVESQTIEARRHQVEQIATVFDIPLHRLGMGKESGANVILQAHQMYLNNTLSTDAERWETKLNEIFGFGDEIFIEFDLDYFNRADIQTRMNAYRTGIVGMIMTPNEARRKEGWGGVEGGDTLYQPTNVAPIGFNPLSTGSGPGSDVTGAPAPGGDGDPAAVQPVD